MLQHYEKKIGENSDILRKSKFIEGGKVRMFYSLTGLELPQQVEFLTKEMVAINSINGTVGEGKFADLLKEWLQTIPYFKENPSLVWDQKLPNDHLQRKNIFALLKGNGVSKKTVIYHCHLDTVGIEDFESLKDRAFDPNFLTDFFKEHTQDPRVKEDAISGDYLFGRGSLDMKSGIAVHIANLIYFSERTDKLNGNILLMINPVEENQHYGIIAAIDELKRLKSEGMEFVIGINNDFCSPLYDGDQQKYIYTGAAGKLLPCFYITGREVHVGETFEGVDPTLISAEINRRVNNNMALAENIGDELVLPPSCLYQRDQKDFYNVQTPGKSYLYFNYFIYRKSTKEVLDELEKITRESCNDVAIRLEEQYKKFIQNSKFPYSQLEWSIEVFTLDDYVTRLRKKGFDTEAVIEKVLLKNKEAAEPRELCFKIIDALNQLDEKKPRVIIFFAPPYCPHNYLDEEIKEEKKILQTLKRLAKEMETETNETFTFRKFFPFLTDSSYLSISDNDEELDSLIRNFPKWEAIYPVPVRDIRKLDIPSINMGVYGKDAHKWTERVYKPYSFITLPRLIQKATIAMLNE